MTMTKAQAITKLDQIDNLIATKTTQVTSLTAQVTTLTAEKTSLRTEYDDFSSTVATRLNAISTSLGG